MNDPRLHPSRLPEVARTRQQLAHKKRSKPQEFTAQDQERLDEMTDFLLLAYASALAKVASEVTQVQSGQRRGFFRG